MSETSTSAGHCRSMSNASGADTAAVELDQVLHERQPEAEAAVGPRGGAVLLPETVEDERENVGADAPARVAHHDLDVRADALEVDLHPPSLRGELHRVHQQIP